MALLPYVRVDKAFSISVTESYGVVYWPAPEKRRAPRDHIAAIVAAGCGVEIPAEEATLPEPAPSQAGV